LLQTTDGDRQTDAVALARPQV